jgi:hypothetical protein
MRFLERVRGALGLPRPFCVPDFEPIDTAPIPLTAEDLEEIHEPPRTAQRKRLDPTDKDFPPAPRIRLGNADEEEWERLIERAKAALSRRTCQPATR